MNRILYTAGLITLLTLVFGSASSNAQVRVDVRLQFGEPVRTFDPYFTDLAAFYNMPYDAINEMHFAGIADQDMPVILYIRAHSQYSLRHIYSLRARGATWAQLSNWCGVPLYFDDHRLYYRHDRLPYGNAYGHYKNKNGKNKNNYTYNAYYDNQPRKRK